MFTNRLAAEQSPYLLQHADNPVAWHPWGDDALARAAAEDKPLLLSVGYAACHWCHVMAHECFEDPAIAAVMNELFVNIKIDREERPDLDTIYQSALALMGQHGGWPLTMFCTPAGQPFWGGTYFPPTPRFGRPGFPDVLREIARIYAEERDKVARNTEALLAGLAGLSTAPAGGEIAPAAVDRAAQTLVRDVDMRNGGIGSAPKFPNAPLFRLLWRGHHRTGAAALADVVYLTLDRMAQGGIYDHLGGGFARYSTDDAWLVPHFEKMLYDNAQLVELYTEAWQASASPLYAERVAETCAWVLRDMSTADGAFAATLDADSEGVEGKYYVWTEAEIDAVLGPDAAAFKAAYDVGPAGNWEGHTILNRTAAPARADAGGEAALAAARARLLAVRDGRVPPGRDDKVLADWNGMMIAALALAAGPFERPDWLAAAERAFAFVATRMAVPDSAGARLFHCWCAGVARHAGLLDDYAHMMRAAALLHEATGAPGYLDHAARWSDTLERHFRADDAAGYCQAADDARDVIVRTRNAFDNATPSGNSVAVEALARLYYLTGEDRYRARAAATAAAFAGAAAKNPSAHANLLASAALLADAVQVVVVGDPAAPAARELRTVVDRAAVPNKIAVAVDSPAALPAGHPAAGKAAGTAAAFVCRGQACSLPLTDADALAAELARR